ncbi:Lysine--tRNA ligase [Buchnera aphidicola (Tetraneura ulmi)]|uniref:lysine--tRNA ligase n=1 Tax=Buchnera aphidicola TaxID=9 RepID=UPI0034647C08
MLELKKNKKNEYKNRLEKLNKMKKKGFSFPNKFKPNYTAEKILKKFSQFNKEDLQKLKIKIKIAGRILQKRIIGKATFLSIQDNLHEIQIYVRQNDDFHHKKYKSFIKNTDIGDIISVEGKLFRTKTNQLSIYCNKVNILTKSLRSLPEKYHGLSDPEICFRKRYLDLITNEKSKKKFIIRSKIISEIRKFMNHHQFLEVETPMLHTIPGGATARPFMTYHNTYHTSMYLRISPELYLKQLIIGGFTKIFEINRNFRNEGMSFKHNPEFTMLELYMAYANYKDMMNILKKLLQNISNKVFGTKVIKYQNQEFDLSKPYNQLTMKESILKYVPSIKKLDLKNFDKLIEKSKKLGIKINKNWKIGELINEIFEKIIEKKLIPPTFITQYPIEVSPLSRRNDKKKKMADRFEFFLGGFEIANGFSELNDPEDQKKRFLEQSKLKKIGYKQVMNYDSNYITALEHGLPPTAGIGIGIDRLIMFFTNQKNIKDIILFPTMRSSNKNIISN